MRFSYFLKKYFNMWQLFQRSIAPWWPLVRKKIYFRTVPVSASADPRWWKSSWNPNKKVMKVWAISDFWNQVEMALKKSEMVLSYRRPWLNHWCVKSIYNAFVIAIDYRLHHKSCDLRFLFCSSHASFENLLLVT